MKVRYVIYSDVSRRNYGEKLLSKLPNGSILHTDNSSGHSNVVKDCLMKYKDGVDYLILLEDDIILCDYFHDSIQNALESNVMSRIVTFFSISNQVNNANNQGIRWIKSKSISWLQCVAYPTSKISTLLKYYKPYKYFDTVISIYCYSEDDFILQTVPNFVQHLELRSTIGNPTTIGGKSRITKCFGSGALLDYKSSYYVPIISTTQKPLSFYKSYINEY